MSQIKAILFDFGGVLDVPDDWETWLAQRDQLAAGVGMTGEALWTHLFHSDAWQQAKRGQMTDDEFWADRLQPLGLGTRSARQDFVRRLFTGRDRIHPAMRALLERLRGRVALAVLSNTSIQGLADWLVEERGLSGFFDHVIGSADVGLAKPEATIYRLALDRLGVLPGEALFIDDLQRNIDAADGLGLQTLVFETPQALWEELKSRGLVNDQITDQTGREAR